MKKYAFPIIVFICSIIFIIFAVSLNQPIQQVSVNFGPTATPEPHK